MQFSRLFAARCMLSSNRGTADRGTAEQVTLVAKVGAREEVSLAPIPNIVALRASAQGTVLCATIPNSPAITFLRAS
jgi:hypothetical protein